MKFRLRNFISLTLTLSFFALVITGLVLYVDPPGRIAYWTNWKLFGMTKDNWNALHTIFGFLFIVAGIFHIYYYNWRTLTAYLKDKITKQLSMRTELIASLLLFVFVSAGSVIGFPPFGAVMDIGSWFEEKWEVSGPQMPSPHTELKTLAEVADMIGMPKDRILTKLERNGVSADSIGMTLKEIGAANDMPPSEIYGIMIKQGAGRGNQN